MAALFPPQDRDWSLPSEVGLTPRAAERAARETAGQGFELSAKALSIDWGLQVHPEQARRWSEAVGSALDRKRRSEVAAYQRGDRPKSPANQTPLLVIGVDGGRWQGREKDAETGSRWHEEKVLAVSSYIPGDGKPPEQGGRKPQKLITTHMASAGDAKAFGRLSRVEAERRGLRKAQTVIGMGDGGNWIDPLFEREFHVQARIIDWCHASEHLWDCAKVIHGADTVEAARLGEVLEAWLWEGRVVKVVETLRVESQKLGEPQASDGPGHPRRVLRQNVGYFSKHQEHMDYPRFRKNGWPIASGDTEAAVKQFNKRIKGTEQFWSEQGVEATLALRSLWTSQDQRWDDYWKNRPAYVN